MNRGGTRTLLIVDDDPDSTEPLGLLLKGLAPAASVLAAPDGQAGVDLARRSKPDVVIMDIRMPVLGGVEAAAQMRRDAQGRPLLLIAVSGDVLNLPAIFATGHFDHALRKPLEVKALLAILELD